MANNRTYTAGRFALEVDSSRVGYLKKFSGLNMEADIVTNDLGVTNQQKKHVSNIKWTAGKATVGMSMGKGMYTWIEQSFRRNFVQKSGTFLSADFNGKVQSELTFQGALITEVTVGKLDAASKDALYFDVGFEPEEVRWAKGSGADIDGRIGLKQKQWLASNFKLEFGDLPCERVSTIDSFTWKQAIAADMIGIRRENTKHPAKVTVPDLKFTISRADRPRWAEAAKKWFVDGYHSENDEMDGAIVLYDPTMKKELGRINLFHLGFKKFSEEDSEANSEKIARFSIEAYLEKMEFVMNECD